MRVRLARLSIRYPQPKPTSAMNIAAESMRRPLARYLFRPRLLLRSSTRIPTLNRFSRHITTLSAMTPRREISFRCSSFPRLSTPIRTGSPTTGPIRFPVRAHGDMRQSESPTRSICLRPRQRSTPSIFRNIGAAGGEIRLCSRQRSAGKSRGVGTTNLQMGGNT